MALPDCLCRVLEHLDRPQHPPPHDHQVTEEQQYGEAAGQCDRDLGDIGSVQAVRMAEVYSEESGPSSRRFC